MWDENGRLGNLLARAAGWFVVSFLVVGAVLALFDPSRLNEYLGSILLLLAGLVPFALVGLLCVAILALALRVVRGLQSRGRGKPRVAA